MLNLANRIGPSTPARVYGNPHGVAVGAMRWNGVYAETTVLTQENGYLGPNQYHFRAPWWSVAGDNTISVQGNATTMDAEINYAVAAKLGYWAFFYYGSATTGELNRAFTLFQASSIKNKINWCLAWASFGIFNTDVATNLPYVVSLLAQSNYQTVLGGRPLVYLYDDGNGTSSASQVTTFRSACTSAGLGNPYIVVLHFDPTSANAIKVSNGLDAISSYSIQFNEKTSFDMLRVEVEAWWRQQTAVADMVPCCMSGWQTAPRGGTVYYEYALASQITEHLQDAIDFAASQAACPARALLCYAWNEHSEGGWLCPTYIDGVSADASRLNAAALALA
ncbi:glycoside hydrolase family 99-like domain-containing protein [Bradyrhizobium sp. CB82]|uniref:glycoside hydrolase family 99-like domain-containing protein n=1 Tax=Bradyrhizobium sp. CB82 TaxID=3039159 RepID=UPI0024B180E5|nr:glycoside hydrolase family 99-like domain-containing protein [Bradyrhizobium sp. CB82]WFU37333.1 glycoside hydrolase family 99-like domain-containing protein [Bradyrhizobium sp. CB82]